MKKFVCIVPLLIAALTACGHHDDHGDHEHATHDAGHADGDGHGLTLNGSCKWRMDEHTRALFTTMTTRLRGLDLKSENIASLRASGDALRGDIDVLIRGCTMQGDAHGELHKFLTMYILAVEAMAASGAPASSEKVYELLEMYPQYFE
jgi:hypothetical protein